MIKNCDLSSVKCACVRRLGTEQGAFCLLMAECGKWIDLSGAARGDEASEYAGEDDDEDGAGKGPGVGWFDMPKLIAD